MAAHGIAEPSTRNSRIEAALIWLGGEHRDDIGESHQRSGHAIAGVLVLINAVVAWLVLTVAVVGSTRLPMVAVLPLCAVFGLLVGAVTRALAVGVTRNRPALLGRGAVGLGIGVLVAELTVLTLFSGAVGARLEQQAAHDVDSVPAVAQASAGLDRLRDTRTALDTEVDRARERRDNALIVARCEYHPSPQCPQTQITGVPGSGPETRTANQILADTQQELDDAVAIRDRQVPGLDTAIADAQQGLEHSRAAAATEADRSLGARWVAMNGYTLAGVGPMMLRLTAIGFFTLLSLLPLILKLWRGQTVEDRRRAARAVRDRAEIEAETAIAVKQAEVRAAAEILWAEQQLVNTRMAVQAQNEIDREHQRRRVVAALGHPPAVRIEPVEEDMYLPIAAEAEAASLVAAELPAGSGTGQPGQLLPATVERAPARPDQRSGPAIPAIPDIASTALRLIRPFVPPILARAIETGTQPLRAARQAFEEVEEITFSFKRTHKVSIDSEEHAAQQQATGLETGSGDARWVDSAFLDATGPDHGRRPERGSYPPVGPAAQQARLASGPVAGELSRGPDSRALRGPDGPAQLPAAE